MKINEFFQVLTDETRLRCLALIYEHKELCVCELSSAINIPQSKISRHLSIMKLNLLLLQKRKKQWIFYSINPDLDDFEKKIIKILVNELKPKEQYTIDNKYLQGMPNRPVCSRG